MPDDLVKTLDALATNVAVTTQVNRQLPSAPPTPPIPARSGSGQPKIN